MMNPGSLVRCRKRDWVILLSELENVHRLHPLSRMTDHIVAVHRRFPELIAFRLPEKRVWSAIFPLPMPPVRTSSDRRHDSPFARGTILFCSIWRISIRPRIYRFVPLPAARRLDPVRCPSLTKWAPVIRCRRMLGFSNWETFRESGGFMSN